MPYRLCSKPFRVESSRAAETVESPSAQLQKRIADAVTSVNPGLPHPQKRRLECRWYHPPCPATERHTVRPRAQHSPLRSPEEYPCEIHGPEQHQQHNRKKL